MKLKLFFAHVALFVPAVYALVVSGATILLIDGSCILLLIWLLKKLLTPVIEFFKTRPNALQVLKDITVHLFSVIFFIGVFMIAALPQSDKWMGQVVVVVSFLVVVLIPKRRKTDRIWEGNGYYIRFNPLWRTFQVTSVEYGMVGEFSNLDEAIDHAKRG